jgi:hypothetical protein
MQPFSPTTTNAAGRLPPLQPRHNHSSLNHAVSLMSSPPPNRALAMQLKFKGSVTDPAQPRRCEAFRAVRLSPSLPAPDTHAFLAITLSRFLSHHKIPRP